MRPLLDLLCLGVCAGCGRRGAVVCATCASPLLARPRARLPSPAPRGLPTPYAVADYGGSVRCLLLAFKERDAVAVRPVLVRALARSLLAAAASASGSANDGPRELVVVPVPSTRQARRRRGYDPVAALAGPAVAAVADVGRPTALVRALRHTRGVDDSAALSASGRAANLAGALTTRPGADARLAGRQVVLVDDVVTTGVTLAEAARALRAAGATVVAAATVAATVRRSELIQPGLHNPHRDDYGAGRGRTPAEGAAGWTSS